jgi:hypothetical protein
VNHPQIKVVDTPVSELLPCDGLNLIVVVERLPELGDNEQILALYKTLLDGTCDTLPGFLLVTVVYSFERQYLSCGFTGESSLLQSVRSSLGAQRACLFKRGSS